MARNAAMENDGHACLTHGGGVVLRPTAQHTLVGDSVPVVRVSPIVRIGDKATCPNAQPERVSQGTMETLIEGKGAGRVMDPMEHGGQIYGGAAYVLIGKVLLARVVIVQGTCWDSPAGHAEIDANLKEAEERLGVRIVTGPYETQNLPNARGMGEGFTTGPRTYDPRMVGQINALGAAQRPALVFSDTIVGPHGLAGIAVSHAFAKPADGLTQEGAVMGCAASLPHMQRRTVAHELGHLLSRETGAGSHAGLDHTNLMARRPPLGANFTDPWQTGLETSGLLR